MSLHMPKFHDPHSTELPISVHRTWEWLCSCLRWSHPVWYGLYIPEILVVLLGALCAWPKYSKDFLLLTLEMADTCLKQTVNCIPKSHSIDSHINTLLELCTHVCSVIWTLFSLLLRLYMLSYAHDVGSSITLHATIKTTFHVTS